MPRKAIPIFVVIFLMLTFSSCTCIYFNTFHNIRKNFNSAEQSRKKANRDAARGSENKQYGDAITKAARVLERHPNSSWIDDALYIIGASYYYLGEYDKSARKFKELFANYPESEYVPRSRILLAKAKLQLKEETEAIVLFEEIFERGTDRGMKADAARALGEYFFDKQDFDNANKYFQALIDSLGDGGDRLHAHMYVADGYFERYKFANALESYRRALSQNPDTLQHYQIMFHMAECNYFLFNIAGGLEKLQTLADDELYYDSLASIRLKMAEGYEWDGDLDAAMNTYEQIIVENPNQISAAVAYYELALIYQYDLEDLVTARAYFGKAREEKRPSPVYEDATKRASRLALLEQYAAAGDEEIATDSTGRVDQGTIDQLSENQFLLGELFYFDLDKADSALHAFDELTQRFPQSRYAPRALMSMAYIERHEFADSSAADGLLRRVLSEYARFDEAKTVIDMLGLSGTVADTGYAALVFNKAEDFLEEYQGLERKWYFPFEVRMERKPDTAADTAAVPSDTTAAVPTDTTAAVPTDTTAAVPSDTTAAVPTDTTAAVPSDTTAAVPTDTTAAVPTDTTNADTTGSRPLSPPADTTEAIEPPATDSAAAMMPGGIEAAPPSTDSMPVPADSGVVAESTFDSLGQLDEDTLRQRSGGSAVDPEAVNLVDLVRKSKATADSAVDSAAMVVSQQATARNERLQEDIRRAKAEEVSGNAPAPPADSEAAVAPVATQPSTEPVRLADLLHAGGEVDSAAQLASGEQPEEGDKSSAEVPEGVWPDSQAVAETPIVGDSLTVVDSTVTPDDTLEWMGLVAAEDMPVDTVARTDQYYHALMLIDSARYYYQNVVDSFPFSTYSVQSRYLLLWTYDKYFAPGDSLLIDLYSQFVDSFPETEYAAHITKEYNIRPSQRVRQQQQQHQQDKQDATEDDGGEGDGFVDADAVDDTTDAVAGAASRFITDGDGNQLPPANEYKLAENLLFEYPLSAVAARIEDNLYFQIRIDFNGEVVDVIFMNPTPSDEINERIVETVKHTRFDNSRIQPELYDTWFYYTREVRVPTEFRQ